MDSKYKDLKELILVPGHAVYIGKNESDIGSDKYWVGGFAGEGSLYAQHADVGVIETLENKDGLLIFSGGQTRKEAGHLSEAQSYWLLEEQKRWMGNVNISERVNTEGFARDSYENVKFGIQRFKQLTGKYPEKLIICGWEFKEERYRFHAETIGWDLDKFVYIGVNNPKGFAKDLNSPLGKTLVNEKRTLELFKKFPFGDKGELLEKRLRRDPFNRGQGYGGV